MVNRSASLLLTTLGGACFLVAAAALVVPHRLQIGAGSPLNVPPELWAVAAGLAGILCLKLGLFGDGVSLRASLTVALLLIAALPGTVAITVIGRQASAAAVADASADQELSASTASRLISDQMRAYRGVLATINSRIDLLALPPPQQLDALRSLTVTGAFAFATYDAEGRPIVRTDQAPPTPLDPELLARVATSGSAHVAPSVAAATGQPALTVAGPLTRRDGQPGGFFGMEIDTVETATNLVRVISSDRSTQALTILDGVGRAIVHPDPAVMAARRDLSQHPALVAARSTSEPGTVRVERPDGVYLAGFARVPDSDWTAITEFPLTGVLAGVRTGREVAFVVLVVATTLAGIVGMFLASAFVRPLRMLGSAADALAAETHSAPLPRSRFIEIQRLADAFGAMRDRLVARTLEREEALAVARDAVRVREGFLSVAAHELKTPLAALRGQTQLLLRRFDTKTPQDPELVRRPLLRIEAQSRKLNRLAEQLLDVSSLQLGRIQPERREVDLVPLVDEAVESARQLPEARAITLRVPDVPVLAAVDPLRIEQVLRNLLDNAVKFSQGGAHVEVTLERLETDEGGCARIAVRDHGLGIPPERRGRLFDRFYQAHDDTHRSGLGLGLFISKQIVDMHAGEIRAEFPADGGTRFIVDLPLAGGLMMGTNHAHADVAQPA